MIASEELNRCECPIIVPFNVSCTTNREPEGFTDCLGCDRDDAAAEPGLWES